MRPPITPTTMFVMQPPPRRLVSRPAIAAARNPTTIHEISPIREEARQQRSSPVRRPGAARRGPRFRAARARALRTPSLAALDGARVEPPISRPGLHQCELCGFGHSCSVHKGCNTEPWCGLPSVMRSDQRIRSVHGRWMRRRSWDLNPPRIQRSFACPSRMGSALADVSCSVAPASRPASLRWRRPAAGRWCGPPRST